MVCMYNIMYSNVNASGLCNDITNIIASTTFNGNICSSAGFTAGASSVINGNIVAATAITIGASSVVNGNIDAGAAVTLGASTIIVGSINAGVAITLGANDIVNGCLTAGAAITLGDGSHVTGKAISTIEVITYGSGAIVSQGPCTSSLCVPGQYVPNSNSTCLPCPPGTSNNVYNSSSCTPCSPGQYAPSSNSTTSLCLPCPPGTSTSTNGSTACTACRHNTYSSTSGSSVCAVCNQLGYWTLDHINCIVRTPIRSIVYVDNQKFITCDHHARLTYDRSDCKCDCGYEFAYDTCIPKHDDHCDL